MNIQCIYTCSMNYAVLVVNQKGKEGLHVHAANKVMLSSIIDQ